VTIADIVLSVPRFGTSAFSRHHLGIHIKTEPTISLYSTVEWKALVHIRGCLGTSKSTFGRTPGIMKKVESSYHKVPKY
jgi:hypothetical protein